MIMGAAGDDHDDDIDSQKPADEDQEKAALEKSDIDRDFAYLTYHL